MSINRLNSSRLRMSGLNSGMDTASIVEGLMQAERMSVNKVYRNKIKSEWKLESYTKINSDLMTFGNKYLSALSKDNISSPSAYMAYGANYKENSYFKVTGSSGIIPGNYKVTSTTMAHYGQVKGQEGASKQTQATGSFNKYLEVNVDSGALKTANGNIATGSTKLEEIVDVDGKSSFGFSGTKDSINFMINGTTVTLNKSDTIDQAMTKINAETVNTDVKAKFDGTTGKVNFQSDKPASFLNISGTAFGDKGGFNGVTAGSQKMQLKFNTSDSLATIASKGGPDFLGGASKVEFNINGQTFSFDGNKSLDDIMNEVNTRGAGTSAHSKVRMTLNEKTGEFVIRSLDSGANLTINNSSGKMFGSDSLIGIDSQTVSKVTTVSTKDTLSQVAVKMNMNLQLDADGKFAFSVNGKEFKFDPEESMSSVMSKINGSDAGVRMNYSELTDSFTFTSTKLGTEGKVDLANVGSSNAFGAGGIFAMNGALSAVGSDASITVNGKTVTKGSNNFTIDGMNFEITGDYTAAAGDDGYGITFTHDLQSTVDKVKAFVEDYNKMIKELNGLLKEKIYYKYDPLIPEEESELKEKEVEQWTEKAKSGIMRNDTALSGLLSSLRGAAYAIVGDTGKMAAEIGLTTSGKDGELKFDEDTFKKALSDNPSKVASIMTGTSNAADVDQKYAESGFATRLSNTMSKYRSNTRANQIQQETKKIGNFETKILEMEKKLILKEERYWRQYANLEKLMGSMNSQSDWITAQLGALK